MPAERALLLAAIAEGRVGFAMRPQFAARCPTAAHTRVEVASERDTWVVSGQGLRGLSPVEEIVDLRGWGASGLLVLAMLAGHSFTTRVKLGQEAAWAEPLLSLLAAMGMGGQRETEAVYSLGKANPVGATHDALDIGADEKLAILVAGLYCEGVTQMRESSKNRNRMERFYDSAMYRLSGGAAETSTVSVQGQSVQPQEVEVAGDLNLAYSFMLPALALKGSQLTIERVAVRSGRRYFLDLLRQIGGEFELQDLGEDACDLHVHPSELKSTRVAAQRAENILVQVPLLAALATRVQGEIVIRDVHALRDGAFDRVQHLFESLRSLQVRIGEFPEGLVIKGGFPVMGGVLDARGDAHLAQAFALLGLWAEDEIVIDNAEGVKELHPDFFSALAALKEKKTMRALLRLAALAAVMFCGGVVVIRLLYDVSWGEAVEIADQFVEDLHSVITGVTRIPGVLGDPIGHTSPAMHNAAIAAMGLDYAYVAFHVRPDALGSAIEGMRALQIAGLNVTVPHKQGVMAHLDEVSDEAVAIGAVQHSGQSSGPVGGAQHRTRLAFSRVSKRDGGLERLPAQVALLGAGVAARAPCMRCSSARRSNRFCS